MVIFILVFSIMKMLFNIIFYTCIVPFLEKITFFDEFYV